MWNDLLSPAGIIGIIGTLASGVALALLGTVRQLRDALTDLRARVEDLETERDDFKGRLAEEKASHDITRQDLTALTKVVTGEAHWVAIEQLIRDLIDRFKAITDKLDRVLRKGS